MPDVIEDLRHALGDDGVLTGNDVAARAAGFATPTPSEAKAILRPRSTEEVAAALKVCNDHKHPVVPFGGGTSLVQGSIAGPGEIILSLERMNQIEGIDPVNGTMRVQSGVVLQTAQTAAKEAGFLFPYDLAARGSCTVGGNISTNAGGNKVLRYGMTRENILGLEAVLPDGRVVSSMYEIIKNNTGLDLKHLFIGSEGLFGIVTRAVIRLRPKTLSRETALVGLNSFDDLLRLLGDVQRRIGSNLSSFEALWHSYYKRVCEPDGRHQRPLTTDYPHYVLFEMEGNDPNADHDLFERVLADLFEQEIIADGVVAQSDKEADALWALRDGIDGTPAFMEAKWFDVSMSPHLMPAYLTEIDDAMEAKWPGYELIVFGHLGDGNLHIGVNTGSKEHVAGIEKIVYTALQARRGSISAEHGVGLEKKAYLGMSRSGTEIEIMKSIKGLLDPNNILNNGKVFP